VIVIPYISSINNFNAFIILRTACSTDVTVTMGFGGTKTWPISPADFNLGSVDQRGQMCLGGIFDLDAGTNGALGSGGPGWVVGDVFLVRIQ